MMIQLILIGLLAIYVAYPPIQPYMPPLAVLIYTIFTEFAVFNPLETPPKILSSMKLLLDLEGFISSFLSAAVLANDMLVAAVLNFLQVILMATQASIMILVLYYYNDELYSVKPSDHNNQTHQASIIKKLRSSLRLKRSRYMPKTSRIINSVSVSWLLIISVVARAKILSLPAPSETNITTLIESLLILSSFGWIGITYAHFK